MSGRHTMPPAGRRKAAAAPAEPEQASPEPEVVEETSPADPVETVAVTEAEPVTDAPVDVTEDDAAEVAGSDSDTAEPSAEPAEPDAEVPCARSRVSAPVVLAAVALVLAVACAVLRWMIVAQDQSDTARDESVQAAKEITAQMLSYETETVDQQLTAARDRMTGEFLGKYSAMINEVIPAAHAQQIAAVADVLRAGVVSAKPDSAELVLFVNQSVQVGNNMPQKTASVARATMVKVDDRWMMSKYDPVPM
ncbi:hypothetical protein A5731_15455 [Mycolicibacterium conceptionense]|uniref:Mce associated membrane protein n=1 Tax=Mycolicibacterium conceptionense TaxID=451644 RepID=A0A1A1W7L2_9MYCO|nr:MULTISPECIES: hypothetical protein [Mycolicibacterium]MCW1822426.1 hypothetical protein [Mycolicibacterium senegalense]OBB12712.1 hypothetical protein A5718_04365 [Mycolicibacterium conceptionense]OBF02471.1 hypothetical protein A5731_15455 [Mycolicibacterium conceptionense]OBF14156.1 hypothetical protein A5726_25405 [Mycolicibacterium conceptionense]OBF42742.1 hypothetical protein A5720_14625 [Mycolicibacterium conceptionense]